MTADTSAVVAALSAWHEDHDIAAQALRDVTALPAHVVLEAYSVLTRLPAGLAVAPAVAAAVLDDRFPEPPLRIDDATRKLLPGRLSTSGVFGGASYDGLVGLEASINAAELITLDHRAQGTYRRLGVPFTAL